MQNLLEKNFSLAFNEVAGWKFSKIYKKTSVEESHNNVAGWEISQNSQYAGVSFLTKLKVEKCIQCALTHNWNVR